MITLILKSFSAKFSKICQEHGIKFIGASPEMIDRMGDKANAKKWATKSIELAKAKGDDYADTKKILDSL